MTSPLQASKVRIVIRVKGNHTYFGGLIALYAPVKQILLKFGEIVKSIHTSLHVGKV